MSIPKNTKIILRLLSVLLTLVMLVGLLPAMSLTALAWDGNPYADLVPTGHEEKDALTAKKVTFRGKQWYIIKDDSISVTEGTLTLLYGGSLGNVKFDENGSNEYANSSIKTALSNMTTTGAYKNVADAIKDTENGKLYLLSVEEAEQVPLNVRADFGSDTWWLRTQANDNKVKYVFVNDTVQNNPGRIPNSGISPTESAGVRPALQLDLSKVVYDAANKAFYIPATAPTDVTVTGATLVAGYGAGSVSVTATAADGHTLSCQWYQNTTNSNEGGEKIDGATSATYNIPTGNAAGDYYYYCIVTATRTDNSQTASATSGVATVTVAADTDALVAKLAEEKNIDLSNYYLIPAEDMYFTSGQYWNTGNVNGRNVCGDDDYRVATKQFTKEKLPDGSLVFCKAYYAFETVAWNESSSSATTETVGKRNHLFTKVGDQFSWWNTYELFGFNLTKYEEGGFITKVQMPQDLNIGDIFRIYVPKGEAVAKIGDVSYYTLADAVRAAQLNDTVVLQRDATDNLVLTDGKNIVFDLNGHTLTNDGHHSTIVTQKGSTLEVVDTSEANSGKVDNITHSFGPLCNNGGTVTLSGGTFIRSKEAGNGVNSYYTVVNRGTMTINEGVVIGDGKVEDSSLIANGYNELTRSGYREIDPMVSYGYVESESAANPTLTINGGTFKGGRHTLKNDVNGIATIKNGDFSSSTGNAVYNVGELTISGGTFTAQAEGKFVLHSAAESGKTYGPESANGIVTVTGGTFNGKLQKDEGAVLSVSGGEFSEIVPENCCAEGFVPAKTKNANGMYVVLTDSEVTAAPMAVSLTYTGSAQALVTAGEATGGTMYYAVTTENTAPTDENLYTPSIPTATNAGTYYVWYKVVGDANHTDSDAASVTVTVDKADPDYTVPSGLTATYGDTLADVALPEGWTWADDTQSVGNAGTNTFKAIFTPADADNYNIIVDVDVTVTVGKADPAYTVPTDLTATYGDTLADVALPEGWTWADDTQSVGNAGTNTFKAIFTPADTDNYNIIENIDVEVTVAKPAEPSKPDKPSKPAEYGIASVAGVDGGSKHEWTKGGADGVVITVKLSGAKDDSFAHFVGVKLDGKTLVRDTDYTAREGSTIVTLKPATLEALTVGEHTVTVLFDNGQVNTVLTVKAAPAAPAANTPKTGDSDNIAMWTVLMSAGALAVIAVIGKKKSLFER